MSSPPHSHQNQTRQATLKHLTWATADSNTQAFDLVTANSDTQASKHSTGLALDLIVEAEGEVQEDAHENDEEHQHADISPAAAVGIFVIEPLRTVILNRHLVTIHKNNKTVQSMKLRLCETF